MPREAACERPQLIDLYGGPTPNARKVAIMLEELGTPYSVRPVDNERGEHLTPDFLKINPNGKQPVIIDHGDGQAPPLVIWESGAILFYLAEKHGRFMRTGLAARAEVMKWLMWQMSALGPTGGQMAYFGKHCETKLPLAIERFALELHRQLHVLDTTLSQQPFVAEQYSIADIAIYPWWEALRHVPVVRRRFRKPHWLPWFVNLVRHETPTYAHIDAWARRMAARPAVADGMRAFAVEDRLPN